MALALLPDPPDHTADPIERELTLAAVRVTFGEVPHVLLTAEQADRFRADPTRYHTARLWTDPMHGTYLVRKD